MLLSEVKRDILAANKQECINAIYNASTAVDFIRVLNTYAVSSLIDYSIYSYIKQISKRKTQFDTAKALAIAEINKIRI